MTPAQFVFWKVNFPDLTEPQIVSAIAYVEAMWYGVLNFWGSLPQAVQAQKRLYLESLLVAWYLASMYPTQTQNVVSSGGMPIQSKSAGGLSVTFMGIEVQEAMKPLLSNTFGLQAIQAIASDPERNMIYG